MILVDTSVWIDFLQGGSHWTVDRLEKMVLERESIAYIDLILLEILQGVRDRSERERIDERFRAFVELEIKRGSVLLAAEIYQELQRKGFRIRSIVDCLIAAVAIETGATILHKDRDFDQVARVYSVAIETI